MARLQPLAPADMTEAQRAVHDASLRPSRTAGPRPPRPFTAWLRSPDLARRAFQLGEFARHEADLPPPLVQIAALTVARHWSAQYLWRTRKEEALRLGLPAAAIDAIAERREPRFGDAAERAVHAFSHGLLRHHAVADDVYRAALDALGERGVVELTGVLGYYTLVAMTLVAFELGLPDGVPPDLAP